MEWRSYDLPRGAVMKRFLESCDKTGDIIADEQTKTMITCVKRYSGYESSNRFTIRGSSVWYSSVRSRKRADADFRSRMETEASRRWFALWGSARRYGRHLFSELQGTPVLGDYEENVV